MLISVLCLRSLPPLTGVLQGPGLKVPHGVLFGQFWAPASECPEECFLSAFGHVKAQKTPTKHSKSTLRGTPRQVPKLPKKHSVGHFQARAPEHSCKWRQGSQFFAAIPMEKPFAEKIAVKNGSGSGRRKWPTELTGQQHQQQPKSLRRGSGMRWQSLLRHWRRSSYRRTNDNLNKVRRPTMEPFFAKKITAISRLLPWECRCSEAHLFAQFYLTLTWFWPILTYFAGQT